MPEAAETTVPAEGTSESTPTPAGGETSAPNGSETQPADGSATETAAASDTDDTAEEQLLSDEEFESLQDDPAALRKALQSAYTKKAQTLGPVKQLMAALQKDPDAVLRAMAKARGLHIPDSPEAAAVEPAKDELLEIFESAIGPEYAKQLKPALEKLIDSKIAPFRESHEKQMGKAVAELQQQIEKQFTEKRPDWKKHEPAMKALAEKIQPKGLEPLEYLDALYVMVTNEGAAMKRAEKLVSRITTSAKGIAESKVSGAAATTVKTAPKKYATPREAALATLRGE